MSIKQSAGKSTHNESKWNSDCITWNTNYVWLATAKKGGTWWTHVFPHNAPLLQLVYIFGWVAIHLQKFITTTCDARLIKQHRRSLGQSRISLQEHQAKLLNKSLDSLYHIIIIITVSIIKYQVVLWLKDWFAYWYIQEQQPKGLVIFAIWNVALGIIMQWSASAFHDNGSTSDAPGVKHVGTIRSY